MNQIVAHRDREPSLAALYASAPVETALLIALLAGLSWAPFWVGSNAYLPMAINAIYFPTLVICHEASLFVRRSGHPFAIKRILLPFGLFLLVILWIRVQTTVWAPLSLIHPIWGMASDALGVQLAGTISVDPDATTLALVRLTTDACVLWLAMQLCRDPARAILVLRWVVVTVAVYAAYGILLTAVWSGDIPFFRTVAAPGLVRSTFVNRNNFATYAGLGLVTGAALLLRLYRHEVPDAAGLASYRLTKLLEATGQRGWALVGVAVVIFAALLGSGSRGGIVATAIGIFALLVLSITRQRRRRASQYEGVILVTLAGAVGFLAFGDTIVGRIAGAGLQDVNRMSVYRIALNAILDSPIVGFGYGTFADLFPLYRDQSVSPQGVWDLAHNTYIEVWLGLGLVAGTMLMAAIGFIVFQCLAGAMKRRRDATPPMVAVACSVLVGLHALVDFSLQIEAITMTYMALLGAGLAESVSSRVVVSD